MKKASFHIFLGLIFLSLAFKSQNPAYSELTAIIHEKLPSVDLSNKIIAFQAWSAADNQSRAANKEFNRVGTIYRYAKLKNGNKGTILISCNTDEVTPGNIATKKDGIDNMILVNKNDFTYLNHLSTGSNIVYDNTGTKVYENLPSGQIFNSYNQLITR